MVDALENFMAARRTPEASPDLARRIIEAAEKHHQPRRGQAAPLREWLAAFRAGLVMPQPAFVMAALVLAGGILGFYAGSAYTPEDEELLAFYVQDSFSVEEWL